jgi:hypothetical protein
MWVGNAATTPVQILGAGATNGAAGSTGYVQYNNAGALGASSNFYWDITNSRLGIGTASPSSSLHVNNGNIYVSNSTTGLSTSMYIGYDGTSPTTAVVSNRYNGDLIFGTNNTIQMRIDSSGNVGVGVTPSAWGTSIAAYQTIGGYSLSQYGLGNNAYYNAGWKYIATGFANLYQQNTGSHIFYNAPSGTAGNAATYSEAMRIDSSGNVGIGTSSPSSASGTSLAIYNASGQARLAFKNGVTGNASTDGFQVGIDGDGIALVEQRENLAMTFSTNATERMRIDSSGNVGIGTSSPAQRLHVYQSTANTDCATFQIGSASAYTGFNNYRVGTSGAGTFIGGTYTPDGSLVGVQGTNGLIFSTSGGNTERMRIDSSGNVMIGATSSTYKFKVSADSSGSTAFQFDKSASTTGTAIEVDVGANNTTQKAFQVYSVARGGDVCYIYSNGNIVNINNSYGTLSDARLKENIVDATPKLDKIMQLQVRNFNLIGDELKQIGFVAQEIEQVFSSLVDETVDKDSQGIDLGTTTKSVKTSVLIPILVKAIQEQQALIQNLTTRLNALEGK